MEKLRQCIDEGLSMYWCPEADLLPGEKKDKHELEQEIIQWLLGNGFKPATKGQYYSRKMPYRMIWESFRKNDSSYKFPVKVFVHPKDKTIVLVGYFPSNICKWNPREVVLAIFVRVIGRVELNKE